MTPQPAPQKSKMSPAIIVLIVLGGGFVLCSCIGILAAIAIPNFIRFQSRSKQSECKTMLKSIYTAERSFNLEKDRYTENIEELGWSNDGTRSVVLTSVTAEPIGKGPNPSDLAGAIRTHVSGLGVTGHCPGADCKITVGCALNIDNDPDIDVWSISTGERTGSNGETVPAGQPYNDFTDL